MQRGIINRFEGDLAIIEFDDSMKDIHKSLLPKQATVGDVLVFNGDQISIDYVEKNKSA